MRFFERHIQKTVWIINYIILWPLLRLFYSFRISVHEKSRLAHGPIIIAANHQGKFDPWIVAVALPFDMFLRVLPIRYMGATMYTSPVLNFLEKILVLPLIHSFYGVIRIGKARRKREKLRPFITALKNKDSIGIFPEGAVSNVGKIAPLKDGVALLQKETGLQILPITIRYREGKFLRRRCTIYIGNLISPQKSAPVSEIKRQIKSTFMKQFVSRA